MENSMADKLVIVESPAKAKTINKMLGKDFSVKSSMGHVIDLPDKKLGVDIENGFAPTYVEVPGRRKTLDELRAAARSCRDIYLAPDPDREGEAIAWHLREALAAAAPDAVFHRISYNEVTKRAVLASIENPREINMDRVNAQQARRVLDRIVGYKVSPLLWRSVKRGLSAGRVQSVALRLVCEREQAIRDFKPEDYWVFGARVRKLMVPLTPFDTRLARIDGEKADVRDAALAEAIRTDLEGCALKVTEVKTREVRRNPLPPFITSTLQQAASTVCSYSPRRTMSIAQQLYEGVDLGGGAEGLITYMRTDSVNLSAESVEACRTLIRKQFGDDYCPEKPNSYRSRGGAQEAHEAIRPTDVTRTPDRVRKFLKPEAYKLYRLIWERFVASQMTPARIQQRTAVIETDGMGKRPDGPHVYSFQATASETLFPGHRAVSGESESRKEDSDDVDSLPALTEGEPLSCVELLSEAKQTKPPARYSEAALVKALEANGVGRPSTYAQTLSTLQSRNYVTLEQRALVPTDLGMQASEFLVKNLAELFDVHFTAEMEDSLDRIESGENDWQQMLATFYARFEQWVEAAREPPADPAHVTRLLQLLGGVQQWSPPVKRGRRTYSDEAFTQSIREALKQGSDLSPRQLETLAKIACRYRDQLPDVETALKAIGQEALLEAPELQPPDPRSLRKIDWLATRELDESTDTFIRSLGDQVRSNRKLSPAQRAALDKTVLGQVRDLPDGEAIKADLGLEGQAIPDDNESGPLLAAMQAVQEWQPPVKRGKREFDDRAFCESLAGQFKTNGYLSDRQRAALKRMVKRYKDQIPGYEELTTRIDMSTPAAARRGGRRSGGKSGRGRAPRKA